MAEQIQALVNEIQQLANTGNRVIIAIAGPPAAGKSTFVETLQQAVAGSVVVPMDGFHLDNSILESRGLLARKGSPATFDALGYYHLIKRLRADDEIVIAPTFDRAADLSRAGAIEIPRSARILLTEGNYLLLNQTPWQSLSELFDLTVKLSVPEAILSERLVQRWLDHGLSAEAALQRAEQNDLPNARLVLEASAKADRIINNF